MTSKLASLGVIAVMTILSPGCASWRQLNTRAASSTPQSSAVGADSLAHGTDRSAKLDGERQDRLSNAVAVLSLGALVAGALGYAAVNIDDPSESRNLTRTAWAITAGAGVLSTIVLVWPSPSREEQDRAFE